MTTASGTIERLRASAVAQAIGNTPLYPLFNYARAHNLPAHVELLLKAEWVNPGGSVKDRPALEIVRRALERGHLADDRILLDATSGNTGIAYAMLGAAFGISIELVLPGSASDERKQMLAAYGARVIESDPFDGSNGAIRQVRELAAADPDRYFYADQYANPDNPAAHERSTGPELWRQTTGRITHFVAGLGTTGTMMGVGRYLRAQNQDVQLVGVQPDDSFHGIEGLKHMPSAIVPGIYESEIVDRQLAVATEVAYDETRRLARTEGFFAGTSTGAALAGALQVAREATEPSVIVVLAPDGGGKYLSTELWS